MIPVNLSALAKITTGTHYGADVTINQVTTDTRKLSPGALFIALIGERYDGHDFIANAVAAGAAALLVSRPVESDIPQVVIDDTRFALGQLAGWIRQQVPARMVGLTGSSGKTLVKEMTAAILCQCGKTLYTEGNFNNDIGVPLTLLRLTPEHQYAVIEMGANHQGEIARATALVRPEAALVNNLAAAHLEGFGSIEGVAKAKGEIFEGLPEQGIAILNAESHDLGRWQEILSDKTVYRFSPEYHQGVDYWASDIEISAEGTRFRLHTPQGEIPVLLLLPGRHNIANALAASALAQAVGAPFSAIEAGLKTLQAVAGRLFPVALSATQLILDDTYNANVGSMTAAVQVLSEMPGYRVMVTGDMAELGAETESYHRAVGQAIHAADIDKTLSVGDFSHWISEESGEGEHFVSKVLLTERLKALLSEHQEITILIKGSRSAAMEEIVQQLQEKGAC